MASTAKRIYTTPSSPDGASLPVLGRLKTREFERFPHPVAVERRQLSEAFDNYRLSIPAARLSVAGTDLHRRPLTVSPEDFLGLHK